MVDNRIRVLKEIREAPGTALEVAAELGMKQNHCSAYLSKLEKMGLVIKTGKVPSREDGYGGRPLNYYEPK